MMSYSFHISNGKHSIRTKKDLQGVSSHDLRSYGKNEKYNPEQISILVGSESIYQDVRDIYDRVFEPERKIFDAKKKRKDQRIGNYFNYISDSAKNDLAVEIIIQLGDKEDWRDISYEERKDMMEDAFKSQIESLKAMLPDFEIASAVAHYDESSPHLHIVGVPIATGYKRGLPIQVAKSKVFTPDSLEMLQNNMRSDLEMYFMQEDKDISLKPKEKGRNRDFIANSEEMAAYYKLKEETADLKEEKEALVSDLDNIREELTQKADERDEVDKNTLKAKKALIEAENALLAKEEELDALDKLKKSLESMITDTINRFYKALKAINKALDMFCENKKLSEEELQRYDKAISKQILYTKKGKSLIEKSLEAVKDKDKDTSTVIDTNNALNTLIDDMEEDEDLDL